MKCNWGAKIEELSFASCFVYCPKSAKVPENRREILEKVELSRKLMKAIKRETIVHSEAFGDLPASKFVAKVLRRVISQNDLIDEFFGTGTILLVHVPRSSPIQRGALWPSYEIARAIELEFEGVAKVVLVLKRVQRVPTSSNVSPGERRRPTDHYNSMRAKKYKLKSSRFLLVDDIVTRGHTFLGAAWRLKEVFPKSEIKAFAAMRTISGNCNFDKVLDPVVGTITYRGECDDCLRRP